jgi:hypothetical protein
VRSSSREPAALTPDQRLREVAALLARGLLRLRDRRLLPDPSTPEYLPESVSNCLELSGETVLSVHTG